MAHPRPTEVEPDEHPAHPDSQVVRFQTRPGRFVFAERNNPDGWLATDIAVDPEP